MVGVKPALPQPIIYCPNWVKEVSKPLILATRRSPLAMRQAEIAATSISKILNREIKFLPLVTTGDRQSDWSLEKSGGKGLFTKELEVALLQGKADLAVHSAKDMPTEMPDGLSLTAFLPRENPSDMLILKDGITEPRVIASGSPRRRAQARIQFSRAEWVELRGSVETRLKKIAERGEAEATFLASAGLNRLGITEFPGLSFRELHLNTMVPAPGQGAIAIQSRSSEKDYFSMLSDPETEKAVMIERAVLTAFGGGCQVALGAHYQKDEDVLHFFHESCGIRSMKIHGRPQSIWLKDLLQWTRCK